MRRSIVPAIVLLIASCGGDSALSDSARSVCETLELHKQQAGATAALNLAADKAEDPEALREAVSRQCPSSYSFASSSEELAPRTTTGVAAAVSDEIEVRYEVSGSRSVRADLTINNAFDNTEQFTVDLPWKGDPFVIDDSSFPYVSAQIDSDSATATVSCKIYARNVGAPAWVEVSAADSSGAFTIATCS